MLKEVLHVGVLGRRVEAIVGPSAAPAGSRGHSLCLAGSEETTGGAQSTSSDEGCLMELDGLKSVALVAGQAV